jgi:glutamate-1-semialdehyde 2,1-aminomutase
MAAGIAALGELAKPGTYEKLEATSTRLASGLSEIAQKAGVEFTTVAVGGIFGFFFHPGPVESFKDAQNAHPGRFKAFFRSMLEQGIYLAPSPYEIGFSSLAHRPRDLAAMLAAAEIAIGKAARVR